MKSFWRYLWNKSLMTSSMVLMVWGSGIMVPVKPLLAQALPPRESLQPEVPPFTPIEPTRPERPQLEPLPPLEDLLESPPEQPPGQPPTDLSGTAEVKRFKIEGSTVFDEEELQELIKQYTNRPITFADLLQVETILTRFYNSKGYINSGAVVPQQPIKDGVITVQIVEGRLEDIIVKVNGRLSEDYVRSRVARGGKTPLNINKLQESLQLLQLDPLVENLNAELSVGAKRDRWILSVEVDQAPAFKPELFVNNSRTPAVGTFERGVAINHNNFAGDGDRVSLVYKNTDGSNDYEAGYNIPINALNGTVGFSYRFVESEIVEPPFDDLDIESETDEYQFTVRQPIILTATSESTQELALGLEFSRQANKTFIFGNEPFPLSAGANDEGETRIYPLRFFQEWTQRTRRQVLAARSQFSVGLDIFDATNNSDGPDSEFFAWRGQAQWLRQLSAESNINLLLRSDIQLSTSELVPLEQFTLGGAENVRGYRQDALLSDNGFFASAEVRIPIYRWNENRNSLSVSPFIDFGTVWNKSDDRDLDDNTLVSLGLGLQLSLSDRLNARLDWGIPLVEVEDQDRTLQEDGIYFSVEYLPF
jgi:hemolysin activation/secretion protein